MSEVRFDGSEREPELLRRQSPWWGIHAARYQFALPYVVDCRVLDIACGTGYGLALLGAQARFVVGADLDFEAIQKARSEITSSIAVTNSDGCHLPFSDGCFDAITSFETLEHLEERSQFLSELRRVLSPRGLCIISTPNANYTEPVNGRPRNPFHVFEYTPQELATELRRHFLNVELLGQELNPRFVISPFWDDQQKLPRTPRNMTTLFIWRVLNKLPLWSRDLFSKTLWGHSLYPGENDYEFDKSSSQNAPVLVAVCGA